MARFAINRDALREYQNNGFTGLTVYPYKSDSALLAALLYFGTGSGKTWVAMAFAFWVASESSKPVIIVAPGKKTALRYQEDWQKARGRLVLGHDLPAQLPVLMGSNAAKADIAMSLAGSPVVVITVQYLVNRIRGARPGSQTHRLLTGLGALIIDEGHHIAAGTWREIVEATQADRVVYMTGTPVRHDKELLPLVPYQETKRDNGAREFLLRDVADVTGIMAARYTLADAVSHRVVKRVSQEAGVAPVDATELKAGELTGTSLDELKKAASKTGLHVNVFDQPIVIRNTLKLARDKFVSMRAQYRMPRKFTAICKVRTTEDARIAAIEANAVGWNAVYYYATEPTESDDSEHVPADLEDNLRRFEDQNDPVDLCIQVNTMTEGYNNPSICMCIWLCNVESRVTRDQFNGRGLRLYEGFEQEQHPPLVLVFPNVKPLSRLMQEYVEMANDMSFVILPTRDGPEPPEGGLDWIAIERGDFFMIGLEKQWEEAKQKTDPVAMAAEHVLGGHAAPTELRTHLEEQIRSGKIHVPGFDVLGRARMPVSPEETKEAAKRRMKQISEFIRINGIDARRGRPEPKWREMVAKAGNIARNEMWPGTEGMFGNANLDLKQLAEFLSHDITKIQLHALRKLRELDKRGSCR